MKEKRNRLLWADRIRVGLSVAILLWAMLAKAKPGPAFLLLAVLTLAGFLAVEFLMNRCPHCDAYLGRNWGQFCQHCGRRIRGEEET